MSSGVGVIDGRGTGVLVAVGSSVGVGVAVGVSQPVVDPLLGDGMPAKRIRVIPNGVDADYSDRQQPVELRRQFGLDNRDFLILAVGSLIRRKGFDLVIATLPFLLFTEGLV